MWRARLRRDPPGSGPTVALPLALLAALAIPADAAPVRVGNTSLTVAVQTDRPPYVMHGAKGGIEVELVQHTLTGRRLRFAQMPYAAVETAIADGKADVAVAVKPFSDVADLGGHEVLAWEDAYRELGPAFERLFAPGAPARKDYVEIGDQREQVKRFWAAEEAVAVIDRSVFSWFSARHMAC